MAIPGYYSLLQRGSSGPDVALVQTWLNGVRDECTWYDALKADGKFGVGTQRAVQEFQLKNKMNMDGKVGQNTWNVLYTRYTAKHGLKVPYPGIVLRTGSSGGTVRLVQQKLNSLGERLKDDGKYGAATAAAVQSGTVKKGDVLGVARIAGIMATKRTSELIPLCHPLPLTKVGIEFRLLPERQAVEALCTVKTSGVTGVEMEALTGVSTALLTIYDMCKAVDKGMELGEIHLVEKTGGKSGHYIRAEGGYV